MLDSDNYDHSRFRWRNREAGVTEVYDAEADRYMYNAFCVEVEVLKELFSCEYEFLDDALDVVNQEFGNWELISFDKKGCSTCVAK